MCRLSTSPMSFIYIYIYIYIYLSFFAHILSLFTLLLVVSCKVKRRPKLKSRYRQRVKAAIEYEKTIDNFDNLVNP